MLEKGRKSKMCSVKPQAGRKETENMYRRGLNQLEE
jgi:hypothetical protein